MNPNRIARLNKRREHIVMTLAHLAGERAQVERNRHRMDVAARERRRRLLTDLSTWYDGKLKQIDDILERIDQPGGPGERKTGPRVSGS